MANVKGALQDLEWIRDVVIPRLESELKWAATLQYAKMQPAETVKVRRSAGHVSDSTGDLAVGRDQERIRAATKVALKLVWKGLQSLEEAANGLSRSFSSGQQYQRVDNRLGGELPNKELRRVIQTQMKRRARGEGFGQS